MASIAQGLRFGLACAAASALALAVAGCSGESTRFNDNPFSTNGGPEATGSVQAAQTAPAHRVESRPLPPQAGQAGVAGGGKGMASYTPNASPAPAVDSAQETTGALAQPAPSGHWTWEGGTPITVSASDTIDSIAHRYGVPASAIMQANNLTAPASINAGQQLVIPRFAHATRVPPQTGLLAALPPKTAPAVVAPAGNGAVHVVAPWDTLSKISRLYRKPVSEIVKANNIAITTRLNVGDRIIISRVKPSP